MIILAIETSTMTGGIAILEDEGLIAESRLNIKVTHSERIFKEIDALLKKSSLKIDDIDVFGISIGPGSFTGLRVGLSTVKGLVYATGKKVVAVSTLEAMALNIPFAQFHVCPMLDARRKEVYTALFKWEDKRLVKIINEQAIKIEDLLSSIDKTTIFLGEGALVYKENIIKSIGSLAIFAHPQYMVPFPSNIAYLAMQKAKKDIFDDPIKLTPLYLRKSEAELKNSFSLIAKYAS